MRRVCDVSALSAFLKMSHRFFMATLPSFSSFHILNGEMRPFLNNIYHSPSGFEARIMVTLGGEEAMLARGGDAPRAWHLSAGAYHDSISILKNYDKSGMALCSLASTYPPHFLKESPRNIISLEITIENINHHPGGAI